MLGETQVMRRSGPAVNTMSEANVAMRRNFRSASSAARKAWSASETSMIWEMKFATVPSQLRTHDTDKSPQTVAPSGRR